MTCAAILSGCAVRVGYNQAPTLVWWWLDSYLDFNAEQAPQVKDALGRWFAWHRGTQLPDYAQLLAAARQQVLRPVTAAQVCRWNDELRLRLRTSLMHAVPLAAALLPGLGPQQLAHLEKRYRKSNREFQEDFLQARPEERLEASIERVIDRAEMLYGRLDDNQRKLIEEKVAASPFDPAAWFVERQTIQTEVLQTLARLTAGGPPRADLESNLSGLTALAQRMLQAPPGAYRSYQQRLTDYNCAFAAQVHNSTSIEQRRTAYDRLQGWEDDLRALSAPPPLPPAPQGLPDKARVRQAG